MSKERRLGRGLEALLGRPLDPHTETAQPDLNLGDEPRDGLVQIHVYEIENNPYQPRSDFDEAEIADLSESLKEHGMIQPLVVRRNGQRYQLIAGERRFRAAVKAGWQHVPAQVREADDRQMCEVAIVENLQRKDLNPLEKAASFSDYLARYGCKQEELANRLKIDRSTVANLIRLLELPSAVQQAIRTGAITGGHARALLPLGDEREQMAFCQRIQDESLSVRATEELVQQMIHDQDQEGGPPSVAGVVRPAPRSAKRKSQHTHALEQELRTALGTKVDIKQKSTGRGQIVIHFNSLEEFDRIKADLTGRERESMAG